jgi:PAS domain S-box-containing protein
VATNKKHTGKVKQHKADAHVLGQILAAQNIEFVLPDISRIAEFYAETLMEIPGIVACRICLEDVTIQRGEMQIAACGECRARQGNAAGHREFSTSSAHFECGLDNQPDIQLNSITTFQHHFGFFVFRVGDLDVFDVYKPFIGNLANYVAFSLENRLQKDWLQKARDELECRVEERTRDLAATNVHLQKEIENRQQVEGALSESETKFRAVFESSVDAIGVSKAGIHTFVNPAYLALFGYTDNAELSGKPILDLIAPSHRAQILENVHRRASGQAVPAVYETRGLRKDGSEFDMDVHVSTYELNGEIYSVPIIRDITERKQAEHERQAHLQFFESMDRVNRAIQGTNDLEQMMSAVLDVLLSIFGCDRAFLMFPCDPEAATWQVPMERSRPEYPGVLALGSVIPMDEDVAATLRILLDSDGPVKFGPGTEYPLPSDVSERFGFQSFMSMAVYPKVGKPWQFGVHQCAYPRIWTPEEERLLQEIGRRLGDALTSLLAYRDLSESERKFRSFVEESSEGFTLVDEQGAIIEWNHAREKMTGLPVSQVIGQKLWDVQYQLVLPELQTPEFYERFKQTLLNALQTGQSPIFDRVVEAEVLHPHSSSQFIRQTIFPIKTDKGYRMGSVTSDITERKLAEAKIKQHLNELERWYDVTLNREDRIQELKREVNQLLTRLGEPARYTSPDE